MNILDKIIAHKYQEVAQKKAVLSAAQLEKMPLFERECVAANESILNGLGIIAEIKRQSPSKGVINGDVKVENIAKGYEQAGASAISVLTDQTFFGGTTTDLQTARKHATLPLLRKDFMVDEYQILEAKAYGADLILLIAAALEPKQLKQLAQFAGSLGLQVLMEVHNQSELEQSLNEYLHLVGVNNRDLKTFTVSIDTSLQLLEQIPDEFVKISESGISKVETVLQLKKAGFHGFLMGEHFMKQKDPAQACQQFIEKMNKVKLIIN